MVLLAWNRENNDVNGVEAEKLSSLTAFKGKIAVLTGFNGKIAALMALNWRNNGFNGVEPEK